MQDIFAAEAAEFGVVEDVVNYALALGTGYKQNEVLDLLYSPSSWGDSYVWHVSATLRPSRL